MRRSYKYRLWTTQKQEALLAETLESHRQLYNACLAERKERWEKDKVSVSMRDQQKRFRAIRKSVYFYQWLNSHSAEKTIERVDLAFQAFFRRCKAGEEPGYPHFRRRDRYDSIPFGSYPNGIKLTGDRLYVQHIGVIRVMLHRPVEGKIKTAVLRRTARKWYVAFSCDLGDLQIDPSTKPAVGIDLGLSRFYTTSDDARAENPRFLKEELPELRRAQRSVSRKKLVVVDGRKRSSSHRRQAVRCVQKLHTRVANVRKEYHYQRALELVEKFGLIAVEDLKVHELVTDNRYARAISDAGWRQFLTILKQEAEMRGVQVVEVDPRGTTQECSGCHAVVPKDIRVRRHQCPQCGLDIDRDHNAARNILARAVLDRTGPAGLNADNGLRVPESSE